jgi:hypothetical protein
MGGLGYRGSPVTNGREIVEERWVTVGIPRNNEMLWANTRKLDCAGRLSWNRNRFDKRDVTPLYPGDPGFLFGARSSRSNRLRTE